jgi:hypothetical protein
MTERLDNRPAPSNEDYLVPIEPYYDSLLQYRVLQAMGYPVRVEELEAKDIGNDVWPGDEIFQWDKQAYPYWANLTVTVPDFEKWIETCDCPGDMVKVDIGYQKQIDDHPIRLVFEASITDCGIISYYLDQLKSDGEIEAMTLGNSGVLTEELLEQLFMAAYERGRQREAIGHPGYISDINQNDIELYQELAYRGQEAAKSEDLMAIIWDYYAFLEKISPEFASFKQV